MKVDSEGTRIIANYDGIHNNLHSNYCDMQ